jgi:hypothetical protein
MREEPLGRLLEAIARDEMFAVAASVEITRSGTGVRSAPSARSAEAAPGQVETFDFLNPDAGGAPAATPAPVAYTPSHEERVVSGTDDPLNVVLTLKIYSFEVPAP